VKLNTDIHNNDAVSFYLKYYYTYGMTITFLIGLHKTVKNVMCNIRHLLEFV